MNRSPARNLTVARSLLAMVLLLAAAGCVNLSAVRDFAAASSRSSEMTGLVNQYAESPARLKRYQPQARHAELDRIGERRAAQKERILLRHALIGEYMDALGRLADDDLVTYDSEIDELGRAVSGGQLAGEEDADAFAAVAKVIFNAAADGWRQRQLRTLIEKSDDPFRNIVEALKRMAGEGFAEDAVNEQAAIRSYYRTLILGSQDKAGIAAAEEWREVRFEEVAQRQRAIAAYVESLDQIAAGHALLCKSLGEFDAEETLKQLRRHTRNLKRLIELLRQP